MIMMMMFIVIMMMIIVFQWISWITIIRAFQCIKIKCMFDLLDLSKTVLICYNIKIDADIYNSVEVEVTFEVEQKHNV